MKVKFFSLNHNHANNLILLLFLLEAETWMEHGTWEVKSEFHGIRNSSTWYKILLMPNDFQWCANKRMHCIFLPLHHHKRRKHTYEPERSAGPESEHWSRILMEYTLQVCYGHSLNFATSKHKVYQWRPQPCLVREQLSRQLYDTGNKVFFFFLSNWKQTNETRKEEA